jgi:enoyl-[acyl-carrier protein] reductase I
MLPIDLTGKRAFVAGVADDKGYGWAIVRALARAGASICVGTWPPTLKIFTKSLERGKLDMALPDGGEIVLEKIYPLDAVFDTPRRRARGRPQRQALRGADRIHDPGGGGSAAADFGEPCLDVIVHSLANGPEVQKPLLETSRAGYLAAVSASAYSMVSMVQRFGPLTRPGGGARLALVPGRRARDPRLRRRHELGEGGARGRHAHARVRGRAALGPAREHHQRGPLASRAAKAIGTIDRMVDYYRANAALPEANTADEVGVAAAFLCSPLASGITGETLHVDKGYHAMGMQAEPQLSPE